MLNQQLKLMFTDAYTTPMVKDLDKAVRFYTEVLGFKIKERFGNDWASLEGPGIHLGLHPAMGNEIKAGCISIVLTVKDLKKAMEQLKKKGASFSKITEDKMVKIAHFKDPDGNPLYFCQLMY